jgi:hypothetical protein
MDGSDAPRPLSSAPANQHSPRFSLDFDVDTSGDRFLFSLPVDPRPGAVIAVVLGWRAAIGGSESERDN